MTPNVNYGPIVNKTTVTKKEWTVDTFNNWSEPQGEWKSRSPKVKFCMILFANLSKNIDVLFLKGKDIEIDNRFVLERIREGSGDGSPGQCGILVVMYTHQYKENWDVCIDQWIVSMPLSWLWYLGYRYVGSLCIISYSCTCTYNDHKIKSLIKSN